MASLLPSILLLIYLLGLPPHHLKSRPSLIGPHPWMLTYLEAEMRVVHLEHLHHTVSLNTSQLQC